MKLIRSVGLACVALLFASCASTPSYGYGAGNYGGSSYPSQPRIDPVKTGALVAAGVAALSLYHYGQEKDKRRKAERRNSYHHNGRNDYRSNRYRDNNRRDRGYDRYDNNRYRRY